MKVSEIQVENVAEYLRLDDYQEAELEAMLASAKAFIRSYTGLADEEIDEHEDFYTVALVLCQDMHDNRTMYAEKNNANKVVDTILGMHRKNLL